MSRLQATLGSNRRQTVWKEKGVWTGVQTWKIETHPWTENVSLQWANMMNGYKYLCEKVVFRRCLNAKWIENGLWERESTRTWAEPFTNFVIMFLSDNFQFHHMRHPTLPSLPSYPRQFFLLLHQHPSCNHQDQQLHALSTLWPLTRFTAFWYRKRPGPPHPLPRGESPPDAHHCPGYPVCHFCWQFHLRPAAATNGGAEHHEVLLRFPFLCALSKGRDRIMVSFRYTKYFIFTSRFNFHVCLIQAYTFLSRKSTVDFPTPCVCLCVCMRERASLERKIVLYTLPTEKLKKERKLLNMCYLKTDALQVMSKYVSVSVYVSILQYIRQCLRFAWALWGPTMPAVFEAERSSVPLPFPCRPLRCQWLASQCTQGQRLRRKPFKCEYVISACNFKAGRWNNCLCVHINTEV